MLNCERIFTVPFNLLGAVENVSRDCVINKVAAGSAPRSCTPKA